jgi:predicted DNA-binding transcriptional regulator YafY
MSKQSNLKRDLWIYQTIKNNRYISFQELEDRFKNNKSFAEDAVGFSKRTFHRDSNDIEDFFGIHISYDKANKGYYIEDDALKPNVDLLIDSYNLINTIQIFKNYQNFLLAEKRKTGTHHLLFLMDAIQKRLRVQFDYEKFTEKFHSTRLVDPYFLKEFKNRWYLIGKDKEDNKIKSFGLERITNLTTTPSVFDYPKNFDPEEYYKDCFGIFHLSDVEPEEVILSFKPLKGKYIESQRLHDSQELIKSNNDEYRIRLKVQITYDFIMEVISHGNEVKVIKPVRLRNEVKSKLQEALEQYK